MSEVAADAGDGIGVGVPAQELPPSADDELPVTRSTARLAITV
jgi:hypothetical protein